MPQLLSVATFLNSVPNFTAKTHLRIGKTEWWDGTDAVVDLPVEIPLAMPNLHSMEMGIGVDVAAVLEHIGHPNETGDWPLPHLSQLQLSVWYRDPQLIADLLTGRWGGGAEDVEGIRPRKLDELVLPRDVSREVKELVRTGFWRTGGAADVVLANPYHAGVTI